MGVFTIRFMANPILGGHRYDARKIFEDIQFLRTAIQRLDKNDKEARSALINSLRNKRAAMRIPHISRFCQISHKQAKQPILIPALTDVGHTKELYADIKSKRAHLEEQVRNIRAARRHVKTVHKQIHNVAYHIVGGTHSRSDQFLEMKSTIGHKKLSTYQYPKSLDAHIGVEIEFLCPYGERTEVNGFFVEAKLTDKVRIMTDRTVQEKGLYGWEACIIAKEHSYRGIVEDVCQVLKNMKASVNSSCGLHIHIDARKRDVKTLYHNMVSSQELFFRLTTPDRRKNKYCAPQASKEWDQASASHWSAISSMSYVKHGTIEIRTHYGTLDARSIIAWGDLLITLANLKDPLKKDVVCIQDVHKLLDAHPEHFKYLKQQYDALSKG